MRSEKMPERYCKAPVMVITSDRENVHRDPCYKPAWYLGKKAEHTLELCIEHGREYRDKNEYTLIEIAPSISR